MRIGLIGTFDVNNYGDCLFPELYASLIARVLPEAEIALFSPTARAAGILSFDRVNPLAASLASLKDLDADKLLLIGGETIGHGHSSGTFNFPRRTLSAYLRLWLGPILAARSPACRPDFFAAHCVGAIKMPDPINRRIARILAAADRVRFRDAFSTAWIRDDGIDFDIAVDPMFLIDHLLEPEAWIALARENLPQGVLPGSYIAAQMSVGYGGTNIAAWVDALERIHHTSGATILLVPICHFLEDERLLRRARQLLEARGVPCGLIAGLRNVKVTAAIIGTAKGYVGSSLHGAVTAVAFARPLAVLGHSMDGKHEGTLRAVGLPGLVAIRSDDLPDRFRTSLTCDLAQARTYAQKRAEDDFQALIDEMTAFRPPISDAALHGMATAEELIAIEAAAAPLLSLRELKRIALRMIRATPLIRILYASTRLRRKFRSV
jgi:polysaccharide pyruvyl transferase WcaK-like protein